MTIKHYPTANSRTKIAYDTTWRVLDIGSGHNPHPRANVLLDRYYLDDLERSGQAIVLPAGKPFVVADACAMPFQDQSFDFVICSHVAEHIEDVPGFCAELNRVARRGYLETPSPLAETLRHAPNHRWYVAGRQGILTFRPTPPGYPLGWFGKLFFSLYFYGTIQVRGRDVYAFAYGRRPPSHYFFLAIRRGMVRLWRLLKPLTYTRFRWEHSFAWRAREK